MAYDPYQKAERAVRGKKKKQASSAGAGGGSGTSAPAYDPAAALAAAGTERERLTDRALANADESAERYRALYEQAASGEKTPAYGEVYERFSGKGKSAALAAIGEGAAENAGNIDSYAAANAHRQNLAYLSAGAEAAQKAEQSYYDRLLAILSQAADGENNLTKTLLSSVSDGEKTAAGVVSARESEETKRYLGELDRAASDYKADLTYQANLYATDATERAKRYESELDYAARLYTADRSAEAKRYESDLDYAAKLYGSDRDYEAKIAAAAAKSGGEGGGKISYPAIEPTDTAARRVDKYVQLLTDAYPAYKDEILKAFFYRG
ncbi:MAG: hypothetical protein IJR89_03105 [Clostridia bacterium]|nr:hypothetical protein [Clostridia bacterium]